MALPSTAISIRDFKSAREFLAALTDPNEFQGGAYDPSRWVFRGLPDSEFKLQPSALRPGIALISPIDKTWISSEPVSEWEQIRREIYTIHAFFRQADAVGIGLPEDSRSLRRLLNDWLNADPAKLRSGLADGSLHWPPDELLSVCGLAQHYGLPTRLLDWSYHPLVAAYFAAEGAARLLRAASSSRTPPEWLCVWALSDRAIGLAEIFAAGAGAAPDPRQCRIVRVTAPTASNDNLRAQRGLFIYMRPDCVVPEASVVRWDLADVIDMLVTGGEPVLRKYSLLASEGPTLLRLLAHHFVHAATTYPGIAGVVQALREIGYWDERPSD